MERTEYELGVLGYLSINDKSPQWVYERIEEAGGSSLFEHESIKKVFADIEKLVAEIGVFDLSIINKIRYSYKDLFELAVSYAPSSIEGFIAYLERLLLYNKQRNVKVLLSKYLRYFEEKEIEVDTVISHLKNELVSLSTQGPSYVRHISNYVDDLIDNILSGKEIYSGYKIGLKRLENLIHGWVEGNTYVIAGLRKSGKTKFLVFLLYKLAQKGLPVLFHSLEMSAQQIGLWLINLHLGYDITSLPKAEIDFDALKKAQEEIRALPFYIDDRAGVSVDDIYASVIHHKEKYNIKFVGVDYVQRVKYDDSKSNTATAIAKGVERLSDMARLENVGLFLISQVGKDAENREVTVRDIRDSSGIADVADVILLLNNFDRIEGPRDFMKESSDIKITVIQRNGESNVSIDMLGYLAYNNFVELEEGGIM